MENIAQAESVRKVIDRAVAKKKPKPPGISAAARLVDSVLKAVEEKGALDAPKDDSARRFWHGLADDFQKAGVLLPRELNRDSKEQARQILVEVFSGTFVPPPPALEVASTFSSGRDLLLRVQKMAAVDLWERHHLAAASAILDQHLKAHPDDVDGWAWRSIICSLHSIRGFDLSSQNLQSGQDAAWRALILDEKSPRALLAKAFNLISMYDRRSSIAAAQEALRAARSQLPFDPLMRTLSMLEPWIRFDLDGTVKAAQGFIAEMPMDPYPAWISAQAAACLRQPDDAQRWSAKAIQGESLTATRARITLFDVHALLRGDLLSARRTLEAVPGSRQAEHRVVFARWQLAIWERKWQQSLLELQVLPAAALTDWPYMGPKSLLAGISFGFSRASAKRAGAACEQFGLAIEYLRDQLRNDPEDDNARSLLGLSFAWLKERDNSIEQLEIVQAKITSSHWTVDSGERLRVVLFAYAVLGEVEPMLDPLEIFLTKPTPRPLTDLSFALEPHFDNVRTDPRVVALVKKFGSTAER